MTPLKPKDAAERFWVRVQFTDDCWLWPTKTRIYGCFRDANGKQASAHRWAYRFCVGAIPAGMVLDHLCRNTKCVNPDHLEPVIQRVNVLRGMGVAAVTHVTKVCQRGHDLTEPSATLDYGGRRRCRECQRTRNREWMRTYGQ